MIRENRLFAVGLAGVALLTLLWFATLPVGILMGDDLRLVYAAQHGGYASSPLEGFLRAELGTYRPLLALVFSATVPLFGTHFAYYQALNTVVEIGSLVVFSLIAFRLSRDNVAVALGAGVTFGFSRFSYYTVGQVFGMMEGLALLLVLLLVFDVVNSYRDHNRFLILRATFWLGLVLFTDERYVVALPFLVFAIAMFPDRRDGGRSWKLLSSALPIVIVLSNVAIKSLVLHTHFLQGSGQQLAFRPDLILRFLLAGTLNVLGFNVGPAYLSALNITDAGYVGYIFGLLVAAPLIFAAVALSLELFRKRLPRETVYYVILWLSLFVPLLLSACVSFRQEFRWLYAPDAIAVLGASAIAGIFWTRRRTIYVAALFVVAGTMSSAILYRRHIDNIYFFYSERIAKQVADIVRSHDNAPVIVITHAEPTISHWIFMENEFFEEYRLAHDRVFYLDNVGDVSKLGLPSKSLNSIVDITSNVVSQIEPHAPRPIVADGAKETQLSFISAFSKGSINSLVPASTPTGRGVFINAWPSQAGTITSLTVLATYRYLYRGVRICPQGHLTFSSAAPYAIGRGAHAFIDVKDGLKERRIYDELLPAASAIGPRWQDHDVSFIRYGGKTVSITYGADVRDNDPTAAWAAFGDPLLICIKGPKK